LICAYRLSDSPETLFSSFFKSVGHLDHIREIKISRLQPVSACSSGEVAGPKASDIIEVIWFLMIELKTTIRMKCCGGNSYTVSGTASIYTHTGLAQG
jgi:hypothetical protein